MCFSGKIHKLSSGYVLAVESVVGREGGRCCQQLHDRLLRFLCKLSKRLVEKLASLKPSPLASASPDCGRPQHRDGTGGKAGRAAWKGRGSGEASPREDAKSKGQRCSPQADRRLPPRPRLGNPSSSAPPAPYPQVPSHFSYSRPQTPAQLGGWGRSGSAGSIFPVA